MLKNFKFVHTEGLRGLHFGGDVIPFAKIDDTLAEQLIGKTHVLERVATAPPAASAAAAEEPAAPEGTGKKAK